MKSFLSLIILNIFTTEVYIFVKKCVKESKVEIEEIFLCLLVYYLQKLLLKYFGLVWTFYLLEKERFSFISFNLLILFFLIRKNSLWKFLQVTVYNSKNKSFFFIVSCKVWVEKDTLGGCLLTLLVLLALVVM